MEPSIEIAKQTLLSVMVILTVGTVTRLVAQKTKIPDVAMLPIVGVVIGPQALGLINIKADSALYQIILLFGASYILFDGGASLRFNIVRQVWTTIIVISTVGIAITAALTGIAAHYVLGVPVIAALLLGATLSSTDPATLIPIFRRLKLRDRVAKTVVNESAFNEATGVIATLGMLTVAMGIGEISLTSSLLNLLKQLVIGTATGAALGYLAAVLIAHERWSFLAEYAPAVTAAALIGAYFSADGLQASGFIAVFVFGVVLGNRNSFGLKMGAGEAQRLEEFVAITSFIMRLFILILLGAQIDFGLVGQYLPGSILVTIILVLFVRPVMVFSCALLDRHAQWSTNEILFMCWTRETGVIPAALAGLLLGMKAPGAEIIALVTFVAVVLTTLIQVPTTEWLGGKLDLLDGGTRHQSS